MTDSLLIKTLQACTRAQIRAMLRWMATLPGDRPELGRLLGYLLDCYPLDDARKLTKNAVFAAAHPGQPFDDKLLRYTLSFCFQAVKQYLAWEETRYEPGLSDLLKTRALYRIGQPEPYENERNSSLKALEKQPLRNSSYLWVEMQFGQLDYEISITQRRSDATAIAKWSHGLTAWFVAERLRLACASQLHQQVHNATVEQNLLQECLDLAAQPPLSELPAIAMHYHSFLALRDNAPEHFNALQRWLPQAGTLLGIKEGRDVFLFAINFCIRQINRGDRAWLTQVLSLYQLGLEQQVFMENGRLSRFTFNNIVQAAAGLQNYNWARSFIADFQQYIAPEYRQNAVIFNLAQLAYRERNYPEAMDLLQQIGKDDTLHQLDARRMLLRIYYDTREFDALESLLDSFKLYIYRRRDLGYHRNHYLNLIKFVQRLISIPPGDKQAIERLREQVSASDAIAERAWLLQQL